MNSQQLASSIDTPKLFFLIGSMGSGKTYWGKLIAREKQLRFIDLDMAIKQNVGMSVANIFATKGEHFFREKETEALTAIISKTGKIIVATGGGTACFNGNMDLMNKSGITIWLNDDVDEMVKRIKPLKDNRPLLRNLSDDELPLFIKKLVDSRTPFYSKCKYQLNQSEISASELLQIIDKHV